MITVKEIRELKEYYTKKLYSTVRKEQNIDQTYRNDTFPVPEIREPHRILRSGIGTRMVDSPAEQIVTSNPQAFIYTKNKEIQERLNREVNRWFDIMRRQNPNPFKEAIKNKLGRGENYIKLAHNETWVTGDCDRSGLPVFFMLLDPMVIYGSPEECVKGIPERVIVFYKRQPLDLIVRYPNWTNPKKASLEKSTDDKVEWFEYWDKDVRYFEADDIPVLQGKNGIQENLYRFPPFVRKYSGFGRRSEDGELANLIVSDIRNSRDLIREECAIRSDIASIMHLYAHKRMDLILPVGSTVDVAKIRNEYDMGAGSFNVLPIGPDGKLQEGETMLPSQEAFQYLYNIRTEIEKRNPFIMAGFPFGASGRQQDMSQVAAMRRYDTIIENTEIEFATAIEMALGICRVVPTLKPDGLHQKDLEANFTCEVKLKASDPVEEDRKATLGDRLYANRVIDLRTNLIKYQGYTQNEAEDIIANMLADRVTLENPDVAEVMGMLFAEESGMERWLEEAKARRMEMEQGGLGTPQTATAQRRRQGEVATPLGREQTDLSLISKGARNPPGRYNRG